MAGVPPAATEDAFGATRQCGLVLPHTEIMREHLLAAEGPGRVWRLPGPGRPTLDALADCWCAAE